MLLQTGLIVSSFILISFSLIKCFFEKTEEGGRVRLTPEGQNVMAAMKWFE
jgi:hypothetical protein